MRGARWLRWATVVLAILMTAALVLSAIPALR